MAVPALVEDDAVRALPREQRQAIGRVWLERSRGELSTAAVFARVTSDVLELGASPEILTLVARAVGDEVRHALLCHALAELYLGEQVALPRPYRVDEARFGDAPPEVNRVLLLVLQSCVNEGIAAAYLQENLRLARAPAVREILHQLLQDDLVHARIGWAYLASAELGNEARRHVTAAAPTLLRLGREVWLRAPEHADFDCPEHGCMGFFRHAAIVQAAIEELILPGFAHVGIALRG